MTGHDPVLLAEAIEWLAPRDGETHVDGTFGDGGYSTALLAAADCRVIAIDRDPVAVARGQALARRHPGRFAMVEGRFGDLASLLAALGVPLVAGVVLDLGVSSMQLDTPERGFSFRLDGPLDMRMGADGMSAADLVNGVPEAALADLIHRLGEERHARRVARAIVASRPLHRTAELAALIRKVVPQGPGIDAATRTFQALRLEVNDEMGELDRVLRAAESVLAPGGRLIVVAFHSLEDRRVKEFLRARSGIVAVSRHRPMAPRPAPSFRILVRRAVRPSEDEARRNPRARSARLRAALRTAAPVWGEAA